MALTNTVTCLNCGEVITSTHRHDFRKCGCPESHAVYVDGGEEYKRRLWGPQARWVEGLDVTGPVCPETLFAPAEGN